MARQTATLALLLVTLVLPAFAACGEALPEAPRGTPTGPAPTGPGLASIAGCEDPEWLTPLAEELTLWGSGYGVIFRTTFRGRTAYYVPAVDDDGLSVVYDACGASICAPDGGFEGGGDGMCLDYPDSDDKTVIWKDDLSGYAHCCDVDGDDCRARGCSVVAFDEETGAKICGKAGLVCP